MQLCAGGRLLWALLIHDLNELLLQWAEYEISDMSHGITKTKTCSTRVQWHMHVGAIYCNIVTYFE